jgi:hypothetical protein
MKPVFGLLKTVDGDVLVPFRDEQQLETLRERHSANIRVIENEVAMTHKMYKLRLQNYTQLNIDGAYMVPRLTGLGMNPPKKPSIIPGLYNQVSDTKSSQKRPAAVTIRWVALAVALAYSLFLVAHAKDNEPVVSKVMDIVGTSVSPAMKISVAKTLATVGQEVFGDNEILKKEWYVLVGIESKFNPKARSRVGALGLGQVMPGTAKMYAAQCGIGEYHPNDLTDPYINAKLSACIYKSLYDTTQSAVLALVAYNAGPASHAFKNIQKLADINKETASYVTKHTFLVEKLKKQLTVTEEKTEVIEEAPLTDDEV